MKHFSGLNTLLCLLVAHSVNSSSAAEMLSDDLSREFLANYAASLDVGVKAFRYKFVFPDDARQSSIFGIDVSHHQGTIDWDTVATQKVLFSYVKSSQGMTYQDGAFARNWAELSRLNSNGRKIFRGAYHFMTAIDDPVAQANNFLSTLGTAEQTDLPACLDLEWDFQHDGTTLVKDANGVPIDRWASLQPDEIVTRAQSWLTAVENKTGKKPIIYTNAHWWASRIGKSGGALQSYKMWIADFTSKSLGREQPNVPAGFKWILWQLTDRGTINEGGVSGKVDTDYYNGSSPVFSELLE